MNVSEMERNNWALGGINPDSNGFANGADGRGRLQLVAVAELDMVARDILGTCTQS